LINEYFKSNMLVNYIKDIAQCSQIYNHTDTTQNDICYVMFVLLFVNNLVIWEGKIILGTWI
jgi:thiamine phosphate synthase YjbQ (UPF0047 family)